MSAELGIAIVSAVFSGIVGYWWRDSVGMDAGEWLCRVGLHSWLRAQMRRHCSRPCCGARQRRIEVGDYDVLVWQWVRWPLFNKRAKSAQPDDEEWVLGG